jgi:hypothetical protein
MQPDRRPRFTAVALAELVHMIVERVVVDDVRRLLPPRDLAHRTLVHIPRFAPDDLTPDRVNDEARRLARRAIVDRTPAINQLPSGEVLPIDDLEFCEMDAAVMQVVNRDFHYIGTTRVHVVGLGLFRPDHSLGELPLSSVTLSAFDLDNISDECQDVNHESALVVSRVYAFPWAPRNSLSHLLRQARRWVKAHRPEIRWLVTYVNPNLGFTAASYRADNWSLMGAEEFDAWYDASGNYITPRAVDPRDSECLAMSQWRLEPLNVLIRGVDGRTWDRAPFAFVPWSRHGIPQFVNSETFPPIRALRS